jgi:hypothetical protein
MKGEMVFRRLSALRTRTLFSLAVVLLILSAPGLAQQLEHASPPIADPSDTRFQGVVEDWTSPSLSKSNLRPVRPLLGYINQQHPTYTVELLRVQWRWGDPIDLYVMKPTGVKKPPVIVYLYGYPADTQIFKEEEFQNTVTKDGFAAVGFMTALTGHRYHDIPMKKWFVSELQQCLAVSAHDVQMVLDYLETRGDLDMNRVGVYAQWSGSTIGILASAVDPRIKVLDTLDPWGDWPTWMATSPFVPENERPNYVKPEFLAKVATLEPLQWMPKIQAKKFRFQQRGYETETPAAAKDKLRAAVPPGTTVAFYKTPEDFNKAVGDDGSRSLVWIEQQLRSLPESDGAPKAAGVSANTAASTPK